MTTSDPAVSPDLVDITEELARRPVRAANFDQQKRAIHDIADTLKDDPAGLVPRFVALATELCEADSAGISLYEPVPGDAGVFRWHHLTGVLATFEGATTPRNHSPCGVCLDRNRPILMANPERVYSWISDAGIVVPEVLLVPLQLGGDEPIGTLWVVSPEERIFDGEDARILSELAGFTSIAVHMMRRQ